jgi:hypothetical protein
MKWARGISEFGAVDILAYHPKVATVLVFERCAVRGFWAQYCPASRPDFNPGSPGCIFYSLVVLVPEHE